VSILETELVLAYILQKFMITDITVWMFSMQCLCFVYVSRCHIVPVSK